MHTPDRRTSRTLRRITQSRIPSGRKCSSLVNWRSAMLRRVPRLIAIAYVCLVLATLMLLAVAVSRSHADTGQTPAYTCNHARYVKYEDGSGKLMCGRETLVIVHVTR